jgi:hypothetical protein
MPTFHVPGLPCKVGGKLEGAFLQDSVIDQEFRTASGRELGTATTTEPSESAIRRNDDLSRGDAPRTSHLHDEAMIGD